MTNATIQLLYQERKHLPRTLASKRNHIVEKDGILWYKSPDPQFKESDEKIYREAIVLEFLRIPHAYEDNILITPTLGKPVQSLSQMKVYQMTRKMTELPTCPTHLQRHIGRPSDMETRVRRNISSRIGEKYPDLSGHLYSMIPEQPSPTPTQLVHTDPHVGNWVEKDGEMVLLDWESAMFGFSEMDLSALWLSLIGTEYEGLMNIVESKVESHESFDWALRMKLSTALSYRAWKHGEQDAWEHLECVRHHYIL